MTEMEFQKQVTDLAEILGWSWVHFRPAQTSKGWRTPVSGPLGKGWVDLVLVHERKQRIIFAELKTEKGRATDEQNAVLSTLQTVGYRDDGWRPVVEAHLWRPSDFDRITEALR